MIMKMVQQYHTTAVVLRLLLGVSIQIVEL